MHLFIQIFIKGFTLKNKFLKITFIFFGVVLLLLFIRGPILQSFGVEPLICIRGEFPDIRIESCKNQSGLLPDGTPYPQPTNSNNPIPVIFDDDGSPDGIIALTYFLQNPNYDVKAVTISQGEAHPQVFAKHMAQLLGDLGRADIPVGYGRNTPLNGENAFPESWREGSDQLFGVPLDNNGIATTPRPATELILEILANSSQPVMMFISGPQTNLAEVLRINPEIQNKILCVYVMGGSVYVPGNINHDWPEINNTVAEWNIWVDPVAASEVFSSGLDLHLVPLDATNKITWTMKDIKKWKVDGHPEAIMARKFAEMVLGMNPQGKTYIWDLVAAVVATDPNLCKEIELALDVNVDPGSNQGQLILVNKPVNVWVCLEPDSNQIRARVAGIMGQ
jgi:purine nucleosidase/pyrimidine-specific ribonucleoside hydrolase